MYSPGYLNGVSRLTPKHFGSFLGGASGAQKFTWGLFHQGAKAADNKDLKGVIALAVGCGQSPVPGTECPSQMGAPDMHGKDMDWVIQNADKAVPPILAWYEKMLGTRDWWGNPLSDENKKAESMQWLKETIGSWANPIQNPDGSYNCGYKPPATDKGSYKCCPSGFKFTEYGAPDPCPPPAPVLPPSAAGPGGAGAPILAPDIIAPQQQLIPPGVMIIAGIALLGLVLLTAVKLMR